MNKLVGLIALSAAQCFLAGPTPAEENAAQAGPSKKNDFALETLVEKFSGGGTPRTISIDPSQDATYPIAICDDSNQLHVIYNTSGKWRRMSEQLQTTNIPRILLRDLDADGMNEVLVCSEKLQVYKVQDQRLSLSWTSAEVFGATPPPQIGVADFNDDGRVEVAVLNYLGNESFYVYQRPQGDDSNYELIGSTTLTDTHGYHSTAAMTIADFCGDGCPEIVVGNDNGFLWLINAKDGTPTVHRQWEVASGGAIGPALASGNFDSDEQRELLVGTNGGDIFITEFTMYGDPRFVASAHAGRLAYGVSAGDLDNDGRDEFVLTRGLLGYAGMTKGDVVAEVWQLESGQLSRVWQQTTVDLPRPLLRAGLKEIIVYSANGDGKFLQVLKPEWTN